MKDKKAEVTINEGDTNKKGFLKGDTRKLREHARKRPRERVKTTRCRGFICEGVVKGKTRKLW